MKAASSHTGALGSSDKVVDSVLNQFGILRADDLSDMFNTAKGFEEFPLPEGNRIAVLTNAGGPAILTVDTLEKNNLTLAELTDKTKNTDNNNLIGRNFESTFYPFPGTARQKVCFIGRLEEDVVYLFCSR